MGQSGSSGGPLPGGSRPPDVPVSGGYLSPEDLRLVEGLRRGDEAAFSALLDRYHNSLLRLARLHVPSQAVAEEVVQETWLGVLQGIGRFEGRSSLKTWLFQILLNRARTRGAREARSVPFSALVNPDEEAGESILDSSLFRPATDEWPGHWLSAPQNWGPTAEEQLLSKEAQTYLAKAIEALPPTQRQVITLRDIEEWTSEEVCNSLGLSETNQRVLLHRARVKVRQALATYFAGR